MVVRFTIPGEPKGKGRPRFARQGNFVRTYTPEATAVYENKVAFFYAANCKKLMFEGAVSLTLTFYFPIPKSTSKKQRALMLERKVYHTKKSDLDNCVKAVTDGLNRIAFADDSQVAELHAVKLYSEEPRVEVEIESLPRLT